MADNYREYPNSNEQCIYNNTIVKSPGGLIGAGNGATYRFYNNFDKNGALLTQ
ncbi:hypothetical protein [Spirosoma humi]